MTVIVDSGLQMHDAMSTASYTRGIEVEALLQAVTALHRDGILTDAECEATRQRLAGAATR